MTKPSINIATIKAATFALALVAAIGVGTVGNVYADGANHGTNNLDVIHTDKECHTHAPTDANDIKPAN